MHLGGKVFLALLVVGDEVSDEKEVGVEVFNALKLFNKVQKL